MYKNCKQVWYNHDIVENIEEIPDCVRVVDCDLDFNPMASVKITGIALTKEEFQGFKKGDFRVPPYMLKPTEETVY